MYRQRQKEIRWWEEEQRFPDGDELAGSIPFMATKKKYFYYVSFKNTFIYSDVLTQARTQAIAHTHTHTHTHIHKHTQTNILQILNLRSTCLPETWATKVHKNNKKKKLLPSNVRSSEKTFYLPPPKKKNIPSLSLSISLFVLFLSFILCLFLPDSVSLCLLLSFFFSLSLFGE